MKVAVAGGGIAGLAAALRVRDDHDVTVFEREAQARRRRFVRNRSTAFFSNGDRTASPRVVARAARRHPRIADWKTRSSLLTPPPIKRYVYFGGRLHALPSRPQEVLHFSLLTYGGKLGALRGLVTRAPKRERDESVYDFFRDGLATRLPNAS